jgi:hypothetical protein
MAITKVEGTETLTQSQAVHHPAHRLADLVQALSGCPAASAELEVGRLGTGGRLTPEEALDALAGALVRLRPLRRPAADHHTINLRGLP